MRILLPVLCVLLFAGVASAADPPPQCRHLDSRLAYYQQQLDRAEALDSELWVSRLEAHIDRLDEFRDDIGCPDNSTVAEEVARAVNQILKLAAQGAITFFTMGAM